MQVPGRYTLWLLLISLVVILSSSLAARSSEGWAGGYSSADGNLEQGGREQRIYTLIQLERLRRAITPRYIRVLDWREYGKSHEMIREGILFTYAGYRAGEVYLAGDFNNWERIPMIRNEKGVYFYVLPLRELESGKRVELYRYKFMVDGVWMSDPNNRNRSDDGLGGDLSLYRLEDAFQERQVTVRILKESQRQEERLVEFAIYLPRVENLSLVGNFNHWNPEHDFLEKGEDGIFRLRLRLKPGEYVYKYVADGRWILDQFNPNTRFHREIEELCSYLRVSGTVE